MAYTSEIDKLERRHKENPEGRTFAPLADAYRKAGDIPRALEVLKAGLQRHPEYLSASIVLGRCHLDLGDLVAAEAAFRRVLELDRENVIAIKALADITERQARFDESEHWLNYLLSIDGSNDEARLQLQRLAGVRDQHSQLSAPLEEGSQPGERSAAASTSPEPEPVPAGELDTVEITPVPLPEPVPLEEPIDSILDVESIRLEATTLEATPEFSGSASPEFEREEDPLAVPPSDVTQIDVGVERHEEIVLRPSTSSEFQAPSDAELLGSRRSSGGFAGFEESALSPVEQEDAPSASAFAAEEPPVPTPEPPPEPTRAETVDDDDDEDEDREEEEEEEEEEEDLEAVRLEERAAPEPLVTETIGDVYAAQGHHAQALEVYRQLLTRSPHDLRLREKIKELEDKPSAAGAPRSGFAASATGGQSVRSYFGDLLSARLPVSNGSVSAPPGSSPDSASTGFMEETFKTDEESSGSGEPTRPASGPLSLSAIFGEDSSPVPPVVSGPEFSQAKPSSGFDEFFGEQPAPATAPPRPRTIRLETDQDDLEQFHKWLKGLKR